jgi:type IV pilus assembly protein PilX
MSIKRYPSRNKQTGLVLLVALVVLAAMTMAGVALLRSVDTGALMASNLSHRQGAQFAGEAGVEEARTWLLSGAPADFVTDNSGHGYFATRGTGVDLTGNATTSTSDNIKWKDYDGDVQSGGITPKCMAKDEAGNQVCYVVNRMCDAAGTFDLTTCDVITAPVGVGGDQPNTQHAPQTQGDVPDPIPVGDPPYFGIYRVTVRTSGPRNNVSFIQVFLALS